MPCRSCQSLNVARLDSEVNIHIPGLNNLAEPTVFVFPRLMVCLACGFTECKIDAAPLSQLREGLRDRRGVA